MATELVEQPEVSEDYDISKLEGVKTKLLISLIKYYWVVVPKVLIR